MSGTDGRPIAEMTDEELAAAKKDARLFGMLKSGDDTKFAGLFAGAVGLLEIAKHEYPPMRWVVKDLLPRGAFMLFSGGSKIGKSWLSLQLASAVSLGMPFLGNPDFPTEKGEVLLLSLQLSPRQLHERMAVAGILSDNGVKVLNQFPRGTEAHSVVIQWVRQNPNCRLIIIDMLEQVRDRDAQTENSYVDNCREIAAWTRLAAELDVSIIGLTHDRKLGASDFVNSVLGSVGAVGSSGVVWSLKRSRGKADAVLYATGWDFADRELPLLWAPETAWRLLDGTATEHRQSEERRAVLDVLEESEEPLGAREIATVLEKPSATVRWLLCALKKDGLVSSPARGKYVTNTNKQTN
jgi:hypothetical protein